MKELTKDYLEPKDCIDFWTPIFCDNKKECEEVSDQILKSHDMVKRLMELGYVLSKFGKDKTYSQEEMMDVFQDIIEGEELTPEELKSVEQGEADYKAGRYYTTKELNKELGLDEKEEK